MFFRDMRPSFQRSNGLEFYLWKEWFPSFINRLSGTVDYIFKVLVPSIEKYNEFYKKLTDKVDFSEVTSSFSMEEIKYTNCLTLNYTDESIKP